ncbi:MAG: hypothetical protein BKP49_08090 [Treponema sp. CETP13]|nr:MAG: hypothetical protein BKP49_08090 [Treponema sp. CETP13]
MRSSKKTVLIATVLAVFQFTTFAHGSKESIQNSIIDGVGREITLPATITKIVVTQPGDVEILYRLGAQDMIVGRGSYCDYPEATATIPNVGSGDTFSIEQVIALNPDVVIMGTMAQSLDQVQALESAGITVVATQATTIEDVYATIILLGDIVGKEAEASTLVKSMQESFSAITDKAKKHNDFTPDKTVYFEVSPLQWGLWTAGSNTFMTELAHLCGIENAFTDTDGWASISEEQVLARNPDFIVTISTYNGDGSTPIEEIVTRKGWNTLQAVTNSTVYNADANIISRPGPRLVDAANQLYSFFYEQ